MVSNENHLRERLLLQLLLLGENRVLVLQLLPHDAAANGHARLHHGLMRGLLTATGVERPRSTNVGHQGSGCKHRWLSYLRYRARLV